MRKITFAIVYDNFKKAFLLVHTPDSGWNFPYNIVQCERFPQDDAMKAVFEQTSVRCKINCDTKKVVCYKNVMAIYYEANSLYGVANPASPEIDEVRYCTKEEAINLLPPEAIPPQWK